MENLQFILKEMGLNDKEIKLYMFLLTAANATAGSLSRKLHIKRSSCYTMIEKLTRKGLVSQIVRKNTQYFFSVDPLSWMEGYRMKQNMLLKTIERARLTLNTAEIKKSYEIKPSRALFFLGKEGISQVLMDVFAEKPEMVRALVSKDLHDFIVLRLPHYREIRSAKQIYAKVLHTFDDAISEYRRKDAQFLRTTLHLREALLPKMNVLIYGHKIAIISIADNFGLITESATVAEEYSKLFDLAWSVAEQRMNDVEG